MNRVVVAVATAVIATVTVAGCTSAPGGNVAGTGAGTAGPGASVASSPPPPPRKVGHVFVVVFENEGAKNIWSQGSPAPYLSTRLRPKGVLLDQYYGIGHDSLPNYLAMISGQAPNPATQDDCKEVVPFELKGMAAHGQAIGEGCLFPASVQTLPNQLKNSGHTWRGYLEGMSKPCQEADNPGDDVTMYAPRHNPFVWFTAITGSPDCAGHVLPLTSLAKDLKSEAGTAEYTFITGNLCSDGHDAPCSNGQAGGLPQVDQWLKKLIPSILAAPAYQHDGMLVVMSEEAEADKDTSACCGARPGPNAELPGKTGPGGGRTGALVISPFATPGGVSKTHYDHYSLLATIENIFQVPHLGMAGAPGTKALGKDVLSQVDVPTD